MLKLAPKHIKLVQCYFFVQKLISIYSPHSASKIVVYQRLSLLVTFCHLPQHYSPCGIGWLWQSVLKALVSK